MPPESSGAEIKGVPKNISDVAKIYQWRCFELVDRGFEMLMERI